MKKKILFMGLFLVALFSFNLKLNASCLDNELTQWAVDANVEFVSFDRYLVDEKTGKEIHELGFDYAYILTLNNMRDDIVIKASTESGRKLEGIYVPGHKIYGLVDYTPKYGAKYKIEIYGSDKSACPKSLLKTINYEIEQFNFYHKTEACEKYPEAEICKMYKDTSDMSYEEFKEEIKKYEESNQEKPKDNFFTKMFRFFANYGIFILLPIIIAVIVYMVKIGKQKINERKK